MVYITSDLFGPNTAHNQNHNSTSTTTTFWPVMANPQHTAGLGKRKRQGGEDGAPMFDKPLHHAHKAAAEHTHGSCSHQHRLPSLSRDSSRFAVHNTPPFNSNGNFPLYPTTAPNDISEGRPVKQLKRFSPKATLVKAASHLMDIEIDSTPNTHQVTLDLRPCHACKSAPKRKRDLENYLDCRRCVGRTCYICARQCVGGCGKAICKKCIVEVGEEGDSWCLDCYSRNINS